MTYIQIINSVLRRLREDTIATNWVGDLVGSTGPTDYQVMIGDFVNEVKTEVEDAWDWTSLRRIETVATIADQRSYNRSSNCFISSYYSSYNGSMGQSYCRER